jgi:uncharacterized alkaline shock family protein YloU
MAKIEKVYDDSQNGRVYCDKSIMLSIINLAAKEISGVSALCNNFASGIKRFFSSNYFEGVKVSYPKKGSIVIDVYIRVFFGYSVSDVAYRVQENIKNGISSMLDVKIEGINIHVLGVDFSKEELARI